MLLRGQYHDVAASLARTQVMNVTSDLINDAIDRQIEEGNIAYDRMVYFEKDLDGRITALKTNMGLINRLKTDTLNRINDEILALDSDHIGIPIGSLILPEFLIILAIAGIMDKYSENRIVKAVFSGLRPAAVGLIAAAGFSVLLIALFPGYTGSTVFDMSGITALFSWKALVLFAVISIAVQLPKLKDLHPIVYIAIAAVVGIVFRF